MKDSEQTNEDLEQVERYEYAENSKMKLRMDAAKVLAKKNCRDCYGRGYVVVSLVDGTQNRFFQECHCVRKNRKKYS